jgi:hypothetical protein
MLDGNITDKIMIGVVIFLAIVLSPLGLYYVIKRKAKEWKDYFSNNRVIFKEKKKK